MPQRNILLYPDAPLREVSSPVEEFDKKLRLLVDDMYQTMYAHEGVGLAAPQVGVAIRMFVLHEPEGKKLCLVNPRIVESEGTEIGREGCLSLPEMYYDEVPRATRILVDAQDPHGEPLRFEATDFLARIIQHESDHLDGVMCFDRLDILSRQAALQEWEDFRAANFPPVRA
jgi:peptide deformylase